MKKINLGQKELIHFVGIGGIGMSGLSLIMKGQGFQVQGSDLTNNKNIDRLKKEKIKFFLGHSKKNLKDATIVVISSAIKNTNPDVVHTWMPHSDLIGGIIAKIAGVKYILWEVVASNLDSDVMNFTSRMIVKLNAYLSGILPNKIIYCAKSAIQVHEQKGFKKEKSIFIPIGFNISENSNIKSSNQEDIFTIGCVARWDRQKNHRNLLEALKILDDKEINYHCLMASIGIDDTNPELKQVIDEVGNNRDKLSLLGYIDDINDIFSKIDLNILPSSGEAFPNIIAESMAKGILCVGTDVGDIADIIGEYGWIVPKKDPNALANAIVIAISEFKNPSWSKKSEGAKQQIKLNYPLQKMINSYHDVWDKN